MELNNKKLEELLQSRIDRINNSNESDKEFKALESEIEFSFFNDLRRDIEDEYKAFRHFKKNNKEFLFFDAYGDTTTSDEFEFNGVIEFMDWGIEINFYTGNWNNNPHIDIDIFNIDIKSGSHKVKSVYSAVLNPYDKKITTKLTKKTKNTVTDISDLTKFEKAIKRYFDKAKIQMFGEIKRELKYKDL